MVWHFSHELAMENLAPLPPPEDSVASSAFLQCHTRSLSPSPHPYTRTYCSLQPTTHLEGNLYSGFIALKWIGEKVRMHIRYVVLPHPSICQSGLQSTKAWRGICKCVQLGTLWGGTLITERSFCAAEFDQVCLCVPFQAILLNTWRFAWHLEEF